MKVGFFGTGKYVIPILEVLRKNFSARGGPAFGGDLALVVTTEHQSGDAVPAYCKKYRIHYISIKQFNNGTIEQLKKISAPLGVLANFGLIIPPPILKLFPLGILNLHPSLLPKYRGPTPGQTAILNGDKTTGVTIIKLDEKVDHGPILAQVEERILADDTADTLYERLFKIGAKLLKQTINQYIKGQIKLSLQDASKASFTKRLTRQDGYFDIRNPPPPKQLDRMIRAYYPWPGVWTELKVESGKFKIVKFLPGKKLQVEGRKPMSYKDFINGYPEAKEVLRLEL